MANEIKSPDYELQPVVDIFNLKDRLFEYFGEDFLLPGEDLPEILFPIGYGEYEKFSYEKIDEEETPYHVEEYDECNRRNLVRQYLRFNLPEFSYILIHIQDGTI